MMDSKLTIVASLLDSANVAGDRLLAEIPYDSSRAKFNTINLADANPHAQPMPIGGTAFQVYVKNLDPAQTVTVNWTPSGQGQDLAQVLAPGSVLLLWDVVGGAGGVTGVSLTASVGNVNVETFFGA